MGVEVTSVALMICVLGSDNPVRLAQLTAGGMIAAAARSGTNATDDRSVADRAPATRRTPNTDRHFIVSSRKVVHASSRERMAPGLSVPNRGRAASRAGPQV